MAIPVSLEDAKRQLRQGGETLTPEREIEINGFIADAASWVERYTGHILAAREVIEAVRVPSRVIELRAWPIKASAVPQVLDPSLAAFLGARLDVSSRPARLLAPLGRCWPLWRTDETMTITIRAGYEAADPVPGEMRRAMLILIAAYDADREGGKIMADAKAAARGLCRDYRLRRL
jgi:hypothetical protein